MNKHIDLRVCGRVQGVFFRETVRQKAVELNLTGWVKNEPDGSVLIVGEGEEEKLKELINWCKRGGTDSAEVEKIDAEWGTASGQYKKFEVK